MVTQSQVMFAIFTTHILNVDAGDDSSKVDLGTLRGVKGLTVGEVAEGILQDRLVMGVSDDGVPKLH